MTVEDVFRRNVRTFYAWMGSVVVLGAGPVIASRLIHGGTLTGRAAGVAVGVFSFLPWMWVAVSTIRGGDEFTRRLHLIAAAISFGGTLFLMSALEWLARARFIPPPDLMIIWLVALVLWLIALVAVNRYFERAR